MTSPGTGDDATGSPEAASGAPADPTADANFDPFRFGRPDPGSPAAAAYPHLFPPQIPALDRFPANPFAPGQFPPPDPSTGYGYPPPGYQPTNQPPNQPPNNQPPNNQPPNNQQGYPPPGYPPPGYAHPGYGYPPSQPVATPGNGRAVAGLILGICSVVFFFLTFLDIPVVILGVIYSSLGVKAGREGKGQRGMALAGLVLSIVGSVLVIAFTVFLLHQINHCQQHHDQGTRAYNDCIVHF